MYRERILCQKRNSDKLSQENKNRNVPEKYSKKIADRF